MNRNLTMSTSKTNSAPAYYSRENFSLEDRDRLIRKHVPQVNMIAHRIYRRLPVRANFEDLVSSGIVGLISAIDRFDPAHSVKLETYAEYKIRGAIFDSLRGLDWGPRRLRQRAKQIEAAIYAAEQRLHRSPTEEEIADELGLSVKSYRGWLVKVQGLNLLDLSAPEHQAGDNDDRRDLIKFISADEDESPSRLLERSELRRLLANAISSLPAIEKTVLSFYYYEEMTLLEISKIILRHESRIAQLKAQAILRLRSYMQKHWPNGRYCHP
jgi:RNA polymerase sigma factor for flagellar operon FliA